MIKSLLDPRYADNWIRAREYAGFQKGGGGGSLPLRSCFARFIASKRFYWLKKEEEKICVPIQISRDEIGNLT